MTKQTIVPIKHNPHPIQHNKYDNRKNEPQLKIRIQQIEITFYDSLISTVCLKYYAAKKNRV
ncbi:hypothetical protein I4Q36_07730 [Tuanshanicoccus lijuaniae]|uniref:hypothetical protein n=1 Tax=Aerococcaceae bacterium zg-1292 TaxID=2774330 RepID=UPI001937D6A6|nr:hypothetical protein [Aerococcaceae bacterium zg-1292]QQA36680.1 hypothetical protein I4Q36_07730 [Aerococcaceae bacterium zg-1292]